MPKVCIGKNKQGNSSVKSLTRFGVAEKKGNYTGHHHKGYLGKKTDNFVTVQKPWCLQISCVMSQSGVSIPRI